MTDMPGRSQRPAFQLSQLWMHLIVGGFCLFCLLPMIMVISISFTDETSLRVAGYALIPPKVSLEAYRYIFIDPMKIVRAYGVSIIVTLSGTVLGLLCTTSLAYVLSRKDFAYRNILSVYIFITMLFSGGLAPSYIMITQWFNMRDTLLALILPGVIGAWNVFLMRGFLSSIPMSVIESAKIDGASEFNIFIRMVLPMSTPGLATVGLFIALNYWNDWFGSLLYINKTNLVSLQFLLYRIMANADALRALASQTTGGIHIDVSKIPSLSARMAMCVIATGPMILAFSFLQKYFARGINLGSVKG